MIHDSSTDTDSISVTDLLRPGATNQQKVAREEDEAEKEIAVPTSVR